MSPEVLVALIVAVVAPATMSMLTARQARLSRREDYARQDIIAERAARVARQAEMAAALLLERQSETARSTERVAQALVEGDARVAERVAVTAEEVNSRLDVIHALVNGNLTAAMQSEHDAIARELAMMREVIVLRRAAGQEPDPGAETAMYELEGRLTELEAQLAERHRQDSLAEAQLVRIVRADLPDKPERKNP